MQKEFRVWYNGTPATQRQLDTIEEIVVEQDVDAAWEARIKIPICIAEDGSWHGEKDKAYRQGARVRIEARIGSGDWVPLIDGTIVRQLPDYNAMPGSSMLTLIVHDDIYLLSTELKAKELADFANMSDKDLINALFRIDSISEPPEIGEFAPHPDNDAVNNLRGTRINMLREMAERYPGFHVYVLPGESQGKNKGYFKKFPDGPAKKELPAMFLTGPERNISRFNMQLNAGKAAKVEGASLSLSDPSHVTEVSSTHTDEAPATGESATATNESLRTSRIDPSQAGVVDVEAAAKAAAEKSGYTLSGSGDVLPQSYSGILRPYIKVSVRVSNSRYSSDYVVQSVTHTLGRSEYRQSFSVLGNAVSSEKSSSASAPAPAAAVGQAVNAQGRIA
jgi:hypothetical protein